MKKALSVLLAVFMLCFVLGCVAYAEDGGYFDAADAYSIADIEDLLADGWVFVHWVTVPSCTEGGVVELSYPDEFGVLGDPEPFPVANLGGHLWSDPVPVIEEDATCTSEGVRHYVCECMREMDLPGDVHFVCPATDTSESEPIPFLQHKFYKDLDGNLVTRDADGNFVDAEGNVLDPNDVVPAAYKTIKLPNCILTPNAGAEDGEVAVVCAICGAEDPDSEHLTGFVVNFAGEDNFIELNPADGELYELLKYGFHQFGDWTVQIPATCTTNGYAVRYCNVCRHQDDREIPMYNHIDPETGLSAYVPTYQQRVDCYNYIQHYRCSLCGDTTFTTEEVYENPVHRYSLDWEVTTEPTCMTTGVATRVCDDCGFEDTRILPKVAHEYSDVVRTAFIDQEWDNVNIAPKDHYMHWLFCENCGEDLTPDDMEAFLQGVEDGCVIPMMSDEGFWHKWGEWICYTEPTEGTMGHWVRTCEVMADEEFPEDPNCLEREEFIGTQEEFDEMNNPPHPVLRTGLYWELEDGEPVCKLYEMGEFKDDFTGIYDFEGGRFFVADGIMCSWASGLNEYDGTWYFLSNGQIQDFYTGLALYDDQWFYLSDGVLDLEKNGLVDYDGSKFLLGAGRIQSEVNGLYLEDDTWYFIGGGQVATSYTGLVEYDSEWFYVENGVLVPFNGEVEYDGGLFEVAEGQVVAQIA
jgi:hypothetical protein